MRIRWYGQSAFSIENGNRVFIDPFGDMTAAASRGLEFRYPAIEGAEADLETSEAEIEPLLGTRKEPRVALLAPPR